MGIIMISDEIQEILENCNRILLMSGGRIIREIEDSTTTTKEEIHGMVSGVLVAGAGA